MRVRSRLVLRRGAAGCSAGAAQVHLVTSLFLTAALASCGAAPPVSVLLVTIDTLRADHLSSYGYPRETSPTLDALATRGVSFDDVISPAPETQPSSAALLTGHWPATLGIHGNAQPLASRFQTLAEQLAAHGYETAGFVSGFPLVRRLSRLDQGFAHYDDDLPDPRGAAQRVQRSAEKTTDAVLAWLRSRTDSTPYFLWVHYYDPHGDYRPVPPHAGRFSAAPGESVSSELIPHYQRIDSNTDVAAYVSRYDEEILGTDAALARLLSGLGSKYSLANTLVVVTADHGESLTEHEYYFDHGNELYVASTRVPLVLAGPGVPADGRRVPSLARSVDVFPTLLELLGLTAPARLAGRSLVPALEGSPHPPGTEALSEARFAAYGALAANSDVGPKLAVRSHRYTAILRLASGRVELYDRVTDPSETRDLLRVDAGGSDASRSGLQDRLAELLRRAHESASQGRRLPTVFTDDTLRAIEALPHAKRGA